MTENEAIEELKQNIGMPFGSDISNEASKLAIKALEEIQQYRAIGTVEECREARERQMAKKPIINSKKKAKIKTGDYVYVKCPCCGEDIFSCFYFLPWNDVQMSHEHCQNCGQAIDWSE